MRFENWTHVDGLVQEIRYSSALAMELRFSCTKPTIWFYEHILTHYCGTVLNQMY